ncbi:AAA family ATPase [Dapis sp. BLCC M229]|uniref:AAA family ATPase n=1 Tax=Dapis sp. BLCC M229 TaxID=3400188 RepID=UPI003CF697D8
MMKKNNDSVPRLDLAPQLKRPLSIWNPLDYLRLLYWVFFFPQAVRWYVENYGGGEGLTEETTRESRLEFMLKLHFQGVLLVVFVPYWFCKLFEQIGFTTNWENVLYGMMTGMILCIIGDITGEQRNILAYGVVYSVMVSVATLPEGVASIFVFGLMFGLMKGLAEKNTGSMRGGVMRSLAQGVAICVTLVIFVSLLGNLVLGVLPSLVVAIAFSVGIWNPENWLITVPLNLISVQNRSWLLPRITPLPLPLLTIRLKYWLRKDWELGLENIDQLLRYSLQFIPVVRAINQVLAQLPSDQIVYRVAQLAENPYDWELVKLASASLVEELKSEFTGGLNLFKFFQKIPSIAPTRLDTPARATAAGFWHLHEKEPEKATAAFDKVRFLLYGEEMFILAETLSRLQTAIDISTEKRKEFSFPKYTIKRDTIAKIQFSEFPSEPYLHPTTWKTLKAFRHIVEDTQHILEKASKSDRYFSLNSVTSQLRKIQDSADALPQAEQGLIVDIAKTWEEALENIQRERHKVSITKPVENPYVIGDPVKGKLFVGREDIMRELEELWIRNSQLQSVVVFGHRRMGKTSILRNVAKSSGADTQVVYLNLQPLGAISEGMGEVFLAISDEISGAINLSPPDTDELLKLPQRTFKLYLQQAIQKLDNKRLIIALDEFETIEDLINTQQLPPNFMAVLRGFVQMDRKIAFAFAGLHTLEEMTEDYFEPFFASVIPIRVGFLNRATTRQLLANPNPDFLLTYEPEAMDRIYDLTSGQPYLIQLLGFLLVRRYNEQTFEEGKPREPIFTVADVDAILEKNELFQNGRYYFTGVWGQAGQDAAGQQDILKALAKCSGSCSRAMLQELTGLDETTINNALETLSRHDVIVATEGNLKFAVELFRRWVVKNQCE